MADVGLGVLNYAVNNLYDKIPNKAFTGETYKPKKLLSKSRRRNSSSRRNSRDDFYQERSDSRYNRDREVKGAVAGAAGGYAADELYDDYRQPAPRRRSEDDNRINDYNNQYQANPNGQSQGDPSFGRRRNRAQTLDGQNESEDGGGVRTRDIAMSRGQDRDYPPARGNDYHRYDPRDYQPRGGYDSDYGPNRNDEQDPYDRPQSADPRRERDRNNDRDRRSGRNRRSSPSPAGLRGIMKKNFEMSDTGITSGALGAIAGGLIGNEVGKGLIPALAGAFIGGLGANAWEARDHKKATARVKEDKERRKQKDRSRYDDSDDDGGSGGGGGGGRGVGGGGGRRGSGYYDGQGSDERGGGGNGGGYYDNQPQNPNGPNAGYVGAYGGQGRGGGRGGGGGGGDNYGGGPRGGQGQSQGGQDESGSEDEEAYKRRRRAERRKQKEDARKREENGNPDMPWDDVLHL